MSNKPMRALFALFFLLSIAFQAGAADAPLLRVTFLDVGQGDSILIRTAEKTILLDAGDDRFNVGDSVIVPYLKKEGIKKIDTCIISHPHRDHFGGFMDVVESIPVGEFIYSTDMLGGNDPESGSGEAQQYQNLHDLITEKKIGYRQVRVGDTFDWGKGIKVDLLHAAEGIFAANSRAPKVASGSTASDALKISANEHSLIFKVTAGKVSYLFPGDAEKGAESNTITQFRDKLKCTVLKSGHHGSKTSSSYPFMDLAKPEYAVIPVGERNSFGHPSKETLDTYAFYKMKIFRTDQDGTVETSTDGTAVKFISNQSPLELAEAPQVISLTQNSATIQWKTNKPSNTHCSWGVSELDFTKAMENAVTVHTMTLTGLHPQTAYRFRIFSRDARQVEQTVSVDGTFKTPAGDGVPLPKIAGLEYSPSIIYARRPFQVTARIENPAQTTTANLSLELYHSSMTPETLLETHSPLSLAAGATVSDAFKVELSWLGNVEIIAVLKKDGKIIDSNSVNFECLPKIFMVDCAHGNMDYYVGKFSGMKVDLSKTLAFEMKSISKPIASGTLKDVFVVTIPDPDKPFAPDELVALKNYVSRGGSLLLFCRADYNNRSHPQYQNDILKAIGSSIRFNDDELCDPTNNIGYPWGMFVQNFPSPVIKDVKQLLVRSACSLLNSKFEGLTANKTVQLVAVGDDDTFNIEADSLGDGYIYASHTPKLPIPLAAIEDLGAGRVACIGETLYEDKLYNPTSQLQTPQFNRNIISWLAQAREKSLRNLVESASTLSDVDDAEMRAVRFEGIRDRVLFMAKFYMKAGMPQVITDAFKGLKGIAVTKLRTEIRETLKFQEVHGESVNRIELGE